MYGIRLNPFFIIKMLQKKQKVHSDHCRNAHKNEAVIAEQEYIFLKYTNKAV